MALILFISNNMSFIIFIYVQKPSRFGSVVAHPDLDGEVAGSSPGHTKDFKMVLTAPQPVLVIMSLSKGNASAIKRRR